MVLISSILEDLVVVCTLLMLGLYGSYGGLCYWCSKRNKKVVLNPISVEDLPTLSVIVPTYNEASEVATRIENFRSVNYARNKLQVVFVDGGSTDSTPEIIERQKKGDDLNLVLIRQ